MIALFDSKRFVSLRWRLIAMLLIVTVAASAVFTFSFSRLLDEQYKKSRTSAAALAAQQINGLLEQQRAKLQQIAAALPHLAPGLDIFGKSPNPAAEEVWSTLQLDMGLDSLHLFAPDGGESAKRGEAQSHDSWRPFVLESLRTETTTSFIDCADDCRMVALAPVLSQNRVTGIVAVSASLADTVLAFHNISRADIAMVANYQEGSPQVVAASSPEVTRAVLNLVSAGHPHAIGDRQQATLAGSVYEIATLPLAAENRMPGAQLLMVEDVSASLAETRAAMRYVFFLLLGLIVVLLSMLYFLLSPALARLQRTARALPLLGNSAFAEMRAVITPQKNRNWPDEVDVLDYTSIALSTRLEQLEHEIREHTQTLQQALSQVFREKAFAASLLDQAQAMIVVSARNGDILTINRYGAELTGFSGQQLAQTPLAESALLRDAGEEVYGRLRMLAAGEIQQFRHETNLDFANGEQHRISWSHSHLPGDHGADAAVLSMGVDITERIQNEAKLAFLADHDPLTGCYNRRRFQSELERMLETSKRHGMPGALLYFDLDHFKNINDTKGHQAGDALLLRVITELRKLLRNVDVIGRLGGDEFAIATLDVDNAGATLIAQRINQQLAGIRLDDFGLKQRVSASIGIAHFQGDETAVRDLLAHADIAMYQAKKQRGTWHVYSPDEKAREHLHEAMLWENRIRDGMAHDHFEMFFQPVMTLQDNEVRHYEALLRLKLDGNLIGPGSFMTIAEQSGLVRELDFWVARKTMQLQAELPEHHGGISFAINLSGINIGNNKMLENLGNLIRDTGTNPERIIFEITETAAVSDFSTANQFINAIRDLGCKFSLDDFGSGFASFYYLKQFPVDYVKIDGSFIRNLANSPDDQIFVRAMVDIARAYGKKTVAEFVENAESLELLRQFGVDYAQGYHIGKPASYAETFLPRKIQ